MATNTATEHLLTIGDAAAALKVSKSMLHELLKGRRLRSVLIGKRCRRIPRSEVDRFIRDNMEGEDQ